MRPLSCVARWCRDACGRLNFRAGVATTLHSHKIFCELIASLTWSFRAELWDRLGDWETA